MLRAAALAILLLAFAASARAQPQTPSVDARQLDAVFTQLQRASQAGDRNAIAAMLRYPITIAIAGFRVPLRDAAAFLERYDDIFTPALRESLARGSRDVTIEMVDGQLRITAITVPDEPDGVTASVPPPIEAPRAAARNNEPRRVAIRVGPRATQIPGVLARGATDAFILYLPKGKLASVRLERVPAGAAVIRVVHATTGAPLAARISADGRFVSGRPPDNGDYRIEVRRLDNADELHLPYMLSLSLR